MNLLALGQCVADLENTIVGQTNNVTGIGLVDGGLALGHKLSGGGEAYCLSQPNVQVGLVADKLAGAHLAECDTRTVVGVDVGRYLEDERSSAFVGRGLGAISTKQLSSSCTPKLLSAEPKNTGATSALRYWSTSNSG